MKRIIDGKRYDTDTAERLGGWQNMSDYGNFAHEGFIVYRTPKGRYFVNCYGGPLSSYGRSVGNEHWGTDTLRPIDDEEARAYLEDCGNDGAKALEKYFTIEEA